MHGDVPKTQTFDFSSPDLYNPVYIPTFYRKERFLHYFGSAGSGKSRFVGQKEIVFSFQHHRRDRKTIVARRFYNTIENSVYSELKKVIYDWQLDDCFHFLKSPYSIRNRITNVQFIFIGLDDVEKIKSVSGVDRGWVEEATEMRTRDELDQLGLRLRGFKDVQWTLTYNPVNSQHWLNKEIHQKRPEGHFIFKTTYRDNVKLLAEQPDYADFIESFRESNPNYYKVYGKGEWGQNAEGLIYPEYETVADMPEVQAYGLDFGYNDPNALSAISITDVPNNPKRSLYLKELLYKTRLNSTQLIEELRRLEIKKNIPIIADSARPDLIDELRVAGYWVIESVKGPGSVVAGINTMKKHDIKVVSGSKNLFAEIDNFAWKNKNGIWLEEPEDGLDHLMDGSRYACTHLAKGETSGFEDFEDWN